MTLVCPACRHAIDGVLHVRTLPDPVDAVVRCACGAAYPVIDGIPIVRRDLDAWLLSEGAEAWRRTDLPEPLEALLADHAPEPLPRNRALVRAWRASREGPLQARLAELLDSLPGDVLELGAGVGVTARDVVAVDHNLGVLRAHPSPRRVCADAMDPPFLAESFDVVVLANLLDACADPGLVLAQADALLRPGGALVVTCAYAFQAAVTPRAAWFGAEALADALLRGAPLGRHAIAPHVPAGPPERHAWPIHVSPRTRHVHDVDLWLTRKDV